MIAMKYTKSFVLLLIICFSVEAAKAQVSNPDTMIHKLFAALKAKDEKAFVALYPNGPQFAKMMRGMMEGMLKSEQMKQMMAMDPKSKDMNIDSLINTEVDKMSKPKVFADMARSFGKKFQEAIENGEKKGVNWSTAKLVTYTTDTTGALNNEMEMFKSSGIKNMKGVIDFTAGDSAYQMSFDKLIYIPAEGGWFGGEFEQVIRKGESFLQEGERKMEAVSSDTSFTITETPKNVKTKTKTKSSGVKTKVKTKSPARKPATKS
jgi:hypothetical protein